MTLTPENRPAFSPDQVRAAVRETHGIDGDLSPLPAEWDQNFRLDGGEAGSFVVKIASRGLGTQVLESQNAAMAWVSERWSGGRCPGVLPSRSGAAVSEISDAGGRTFRMRVLTWVEGRPHSSVGPPCARRLQRLGRAVGDLDRILAGFHHPGMDRDLPWDLRKARWISSCTHRIPDLRRRALVERLLLQYCGRVLPLDADLPMSVIHNDVNGENLLVEPSPEGGWKVAGLVDFGDMVRSHTVNDLATACAYAIPGAEDLLEAMACVAAGYHERRPLAELEIQALFPLVCMRLCVSVTNSAIAAVDDPENMHRLISDRPAWETLERLEPIDWLKAEDRLREACALAPRTGRPAGEPAPGRGDLLADRRNLIGPSLSLSYRSPLVIVRGRGEFLFDGDGRAYLDCVNNVCHVGHCHPKVVAALSRQAATLNTNTRYLHPGLTEYARRLTATLPEPLRVCFFVNSGSEANELAVRIARTHTRRYDALVLEDAYHGNTETLVNLSPYKCEGPGGSGLPPWAHKVVKPDPYRGPHRGAGEAVGRAYADQVREACERLAAEGRPPAFFICETILGCGGQIVLPEGYLREAFGHVRSAGGVCIADEVQVGLGRVGGRMWAFETQGVVPDIVTMGKPIGNGHPIGAVVTTPEIAASFANGMEFFSTFGGNPVSMAVGLAVLEVIEDEGLRERAGRVGRHLSEGFQALAERHLVIGDVRGLGLFMGVELVRDRGALTPATDEAAWLVERLKADGILIAAEGPHRNVLKIKPPLAFDETDADLLLAAADRALEELPHRLR